MGDIRQVTVIGTGQMGAGIAQVVAASGRETLIFDAIPANVARAIGNIKGLLERGIEKGKVSREAAEATLAQLKPIQYLKESAKSDLVIEAVTENFELKAKLFADVVSAVSNDTIVASNTSSISVTALAAVVKAPENFMGVHFMNPVPVMKLVELIPALQTSPETFNRMKSFAESLGKQTVSAKDSPGFIVNRILAPMLNEAFFLLAEGIQAKDIDDAMQLGTNQPMGPLMLADFIGLDTCLAILEVLHHGLGEDKYRPAPLLRKYVAAGWFGKKSGRGVYRYDQGKSL